MDVAAGAGYLVETANLAARTWRTGGARPQLAQTERLATLFRTGGARLTDPRIVYDAQSGRWFASISNVDAGSVLLAVSRSGNPTAGWTVHAFPAPGCPDQPRLGIADSIVVLGADVFASCDEGDDSDPAAGGELWIVNKQQLVAGSATVASTTYGPDATYTSLAPVQSLSPTQTEYVVSVDDPSSSVVHLLAVDGTPPGAVGVREIAALPVSPLLQPPNALQPAMPGRPAELETNDDRVLDSVWENGKLWLSANSACRPAGDTELRSCGRVVELSTAGPSLDWEADLSQPGASVFFPALRPDASGDLVVVFGESSPALAPELVAVARTPDGGLTAPAVIAQGPGPYSGDRYGDYFGAARDPSSPDVVWAAGEVPGNEGGWTTALATVATVATVPRLAARAVLAHPGTAARLVYVALVDAAGVRATVTVRGQRDVVYRATTSAGTLHAGHLYSVLWRPAARLRGTYTFCVTADGPGGSHSARSCAPLTVR